MNDEPLAPDWTAEHERLLIACALQDAETARELLALVQPPMIEEAGLQRVWSALRRVLDLDQVFGSLPDAVAGELNGDAGDALSRTDLHRLHDAVPSAANAKYYANRVIHASARRELKSMAAPKLLERGADLPTADLLAGVEARARHLRELLSGPAPVLPEALTGDGWNAEPDPREWLVEGWLPAGELALLAGPGSVGKSLLALQLGAALACDRQPLTDDDGWLPKGTAVRAMPPDLAPEPTTVVLAGWEDDRHEALRRRSRLAMHGGCGWASHSSINGRLHVLPMRGFGPVWAPAGSGSRHVSTVGALTAAGAALLGYAERCGARLLVIDPAGLAICTNENDRALVSMALDSLAGWAMRSGCTVLLTGHPAKATEGEAADYSGSTAWRGSVRALWTLRTPSEEDADRNSGAWSNLTGSNPARAERVAVLGRNKNNYGWDEDALTIATTGGRAGWYLTDPVPAPAPPDGQGGKRRKRDKVNVAADPGQIDP